MTKCASVRTEFLLWLNTETFQSLHWHLLYENREAQEFFGWPCARGYGQLPTAPVSHSRAAKTKQEVSIPPLPQDGKLDRQALPVLVSLNMETSHYQMVLLQGHA